MFGLVRCRDAYPLGHMHERPETLVCAEYGDIVVSGIGGGLVKVTISEGGWRRRKGERGGSRREYVSFKFNHLGRAKQAMGRLW